MTTSVQIAWIAGLLEGEGHFGLSYNEKYPTIKVGVTDLDTIEKARDIMSPSTNIICERRQNNWKPFYKFGLHSTKAVEWMMTIYPLMSIRRKARIKSCIISWRMNTLQVRRFKV